MDVITENGVALTLVSGWKSAREVNSRLTKLTWYRIMSAEKKAQRTGEGQEGRPAITSQSVPLLIQPGAALAHSDNDTRRRLRARVSSVVFVLKSLIIRRETRSRLKMIAARESHTRTARRSSPWGCASWPARTHRTGTCACVRERPCVCVCARACVLRDQARTSAQGGTLCTRFAARHGHPRPAHSKLAFNCFKKQFKNAIA